MNLVKLNLYGEGYYSGVEYSETIFLLEDDYKSLNKDFDEYEIRLGELDGKYSEVFGGVEVEIISEDKQQLYNFKCDNDGDCLYWELKDYSDNLDNMIKRAENYISELDSLVNVTYTVKKSNLQKINELVNDLIVK